MDATPADALAARRIPPNLGVFVCRAVASGERPVLHVSHDRNGDWQFLCGGDHRRNRDDRAQLSCILDVVERDPALTDVLDLAKRERAWRLRAGGRWLISRS